MARITKAEQRFPALQKITKHPKIGPWVFPVVTALEVGAGLFAVLILLPWLLTFLPYIHIPFPEIDLPDIPFPTINLPHVPFSLPDLPAWVDTVLYWLSKTWPIWIALFIAVKTVRAQDVKKAKK